MLNRRVVKDPTIAIALMTGMGGEENAVDRTGQHYIFGEPCMFIAGHALPNPSEQDVRDALTNPLSP